ncbi:primosomal protein [Pseudonocardia sp. CA-107938]|uniref:primosomal protein n=1 Tax=Pseudonocardia sp. CA-107938 TaxID=3240021 RepID=UPI003D8A90FC
MASDIVPIQLSLTDGDLVTLWAPRWREDGEEWEAFLGDDDNLFAFPEVTQLAAFVRTATGHDLLDHPSWSVVPQLGVDELIPDDTRSYDIIGVPEVVAEDPDTWTIGELSEITDMLRSIAEVCELDAVDEVLGAAPAFGMLHQGTLPFAGREGARLWAQLVDVVAKRWDEVVDALDGLVRTPSVDAAALAAAEKELAAQQVAVADADPATAAVDASDDEDELDDDAEPAGERTPTFWEEVGIDPIRIATDTAEYVSLRCYLNDKAVFLGSGGRIDVFPNGRALLRWIVEESDEANALAVASTWPEVVDAATSGDLDVTVEDMNSYSLVGLASDIAAGTLDVDATQLELACELLVDVGDWVGDDEARRALAESQPLGWLVSFLVRPDPTRLAPSPPFTAESKRFRELTDDLVARLRPH